jgi:hypothetical protein
MDIKKIVTTASVFISLSSFSSSDGYSKKNLDDLHKAFFTNKGRSIASLQKSNQTAIGTESVETGTLTVNPVLRNFSETNERKMRGAIQLLERVVNSEEFKEAVLNYEYDGKNQFVQNNGMTNEQIYQHLMTGKENLFPEVDLEMDVDVSLYRQSWGRCSVVGYTTPTSPRIYVNRCFFNGFELQEVAGNLFHEWIHKMGFGHDYKPTERRPFSVPYALGYLMRTIGAKYNNELFTVN